MTGNSKDFNTEWRKVASTIYRKPLDSKIFGSVEVDITELENFIKEKRKAGIKITLTHIITLIFGRGIRYEVPEFNTYVRRGKIVQRKTVDAMVSVLMANGDMGSVKVENTDKLTINEISSILNNRIVNSRQGNENKTMQKKNIVAKMPWPLRNFFFAIYKKITIDWGFTIPFIGIKASSFGSYVVSNIGSIGLDRGFGALMPSANMALVLILGGDEKRPVVVNDKIEIRRMLNLSVTFDHRVVDANHGGKLFRYVKYMIKNPHLLENPPE
jgi:pyruvate dehydrogenase E2 component (dihydrolipoamide acetyltransferase)